MSKTFEIGDIIENGPSVRIPFSGDVFQESLDRGLVREFSMGQLVYTEKMTALFRAFEELFRGEVAQYLNFKEWIFPRLLPQEVLEKFGSVEYAPRTLFEVTQFYENPTRRRDYFLDTVQSAALYFTLATNPIDDSILPLKICESRGGGQYRNEQKYDRMERLLEYHKLEHVYVGYPKQVVECRRLQRDRYKELFNELGIWYRIVVGAPCHSSPQNTKRYEEAQRLDEVPLFDFEFMMPNTDNWLEVCGTCVEADENIISYGITSKSGEKLWSGCSGVGLDRLIFAFLSQYGFNEDGYPNLLKKYIS